MGCRSSTPANDLSLYNDLKGQVKIAQYYFACGGFSDVYRGEWRDPLTGKVVPVAVKFLRGVHTDSTLLDDITKYLNRETKVWHFLEHPNVVPFLGLCSDVGPSPAMVSPLYDNGHVCAYLNNHKERDRPALVLGIARGLEYLHSSGVIHGDIKPRNVLVDDEGCPRLCDFGQSRLVDIHGFTASKFAGSVRYLAPELLPTDGTVVPKVTFKTDVYGFSMSSLEILSGKEPFFHWSLQTVIINAVQNSQRPQRSNYPQEMFTEPMWVLLVTCWDQNPAQRLDMKAIVQSLERM